FRPVDKFFQCLGIDTYAGAFESLLDYLFRLPIRHQIQLNMLEYANDRGIISRKLFFNPGQSERKKHDVSISAVYEVLRCLLKKSTKVFLLVNFVQFINDKKNAVIPLL